MKKLFVGPCPKCGVDIHEYKMPPIIQWDSSGGGLNWKKKPMRLASNGTTFWIFQSDGSRMQVSICKACLESLSDEDVKKIFADQIYTQLLMISGNSDNSYKLFDRIRTIEVWKWFRTEKELIDYFNSQTVMAEKMPGKA